jgi:short-subunit dehydrogenase involved in D-alanine esterification of teichoic acids
MALLGLLETLRAMPQLQILRVQRCCALWDEDTAATGTEGPYYNATASAIHLFFDNLRHLAASYIFFFFFFFWKAFLFS